MKSERGVTLTSIMIYIVALTIVVAIVARVSTYFYLSYIFLFPIILPYVARKFRLGYKSILNPIVQIGFFSYFIVYYFSTSGAVGSGYAHR